MAVTAVEQRAVDVIEMAFHKCAGMGYTPARERAVFVARELEEARLLGVRNASGPERIARRFHEVYEELAPVYGWETQNRSAVGWDVLPPENKRLMVKTVTRLIHEGVFDG